MLLTLVLLATMSTATVPALEAFSQTAPASQNARAVSVRQLATDVWLHTSSRVYEGATVPSHGLIVREGSRVYLVDTAWGVEPTKALLQWIDTELHVPVAAAVITHFHDDRMGGTPELARRHIPFSSLALTRTLAADSRLPLPQPLDGLEHGKAVTLGPLEIFYPGPAHTRDNVVVWIEKSRVLFGGCAFRPNESASAGNTADADLAHWPEAIRSVQARYPAADIVVPSHGAPGDRELLAHTIRVLTER